jgi:hypothetical protein
MDIKEFLLKYKRQSVVVVIIVSILLGLGLMKKTTTWISYMLQNSDNPSSFPSWFDPYGIAAIGLSVAVVMIILINWTFRKVMKSLEEE